MSKKKKPLSREEVAAIEVGKTTITRGLALILITGFVGIIMLIPLLQHVLDVRGFQKGDRGSVWPASLSVFHQAPGALAKETGLFASNRNLLSLIDEYEDELEDESVLTKTLLSPVQELLTGRLGVGNEQAYIGKDGYLYYRPGFDHVTGPPFLDEKRLERIAKSGARQPDPVKAILDFKKQLDEREIGLIIMPVQVKPSAEPHALRGRRTPRRVSGDSAYVNNPSLEALGEQMRSHGIGVVTSGDVGTNRYLKTDTHWRPEELEMRAGDLLFFFNHHFPLPTRPSSGYTRGEERVTSLGDIAAMLQLPEDQKLFPPETVTIHPVKTAGGDPWRSREDADVLLLGDSFANIYSVTNMNWGGHAGLAEQLSFYLQRPVDKLCINDNGSFASRELLQADLRAGKDRLAGKKVVIWEFAARELSVGDWKLLDMSLGEKPEGDDEFYVPEAGTSNVVAAVVAARSFVPKPGSVPYKDHICMLHLKEMKDTDGNPIPGQAAVNVWSMRDNATTSVGKLKPGDPIRIQIRPWEDRQEQLKSINKSELEDDAFFLAEFCWGEPLEAPALARTIPFAFYVYMLSVFVLGLMALLRAKAANGALNKMKMIKIAVGALALTLLSAPLMTVRAGNESVEVVGPTATATATQTAGTDALKQFADAAAGLQAKGSSVHVGTDGWLFMYKELRHLGLGEFWGARAADVSQATSPAGADPLPTILDIHQQLKALGIQLIFMPVPPKAAIYADKAVGADPAKRVDIHHAKFLAMLKEQGVTVIDLAPLYLKAKSGGERVYCLQDSHWARLGMDIAAGEVATIIKAQPWASDLKPVKLASNTIDMPIQGDLIRLLGDPSVQPVSEKVQNITLDGEPLPSDPDSPILIVGDSHTLFLNNGGEMHAVGSGFPDLLAYHLGTSVDLIGKMGSGVGSARKDLARAFITKPAYRSGKKVVIWLFAGRDFTESSDGTDWKKLPMKRN